MDIEENIPKFLYDRIAKQYGEEWAYKIVEGYSIKRPVTFRVNTIKSNIESIEKELEKENIDYEKVSWYNDAFIIKNIREDILKKLGFYKDGKIYLQSLSSMLPPLVLKPEPNENILDMTAAPGGKTTQISALSNNLSMITACEKNKIRVDRLKYNIEKQGAKRINVMQEDARNLSDYFSFDKILLDAPCSGSGTIYLENKNFDKYFSEELIIRSSKAQKNLLKKALKILKTGGEMVYSTCSILQEENEDILNEVLKEFRAEIIPIDESLVKKLPKLPTKIKGTLCVCPNELFEGFFVAKIKKIK